MKRLLVALLVSLVLLVGCSSAIKEMPAPPGPLVPPPPGVKYIYPNESTAPSAPKQVQTPITAPMPSSVPSSTPVSEPPIPAHFITYTDKLSLFSISYPSDWELDLSRIEGITQDTEAYMKDIESEGSLSSAKVVFFAGIPYGDGHNPNASVIVTPGGEGNWKLEDLVKAAIQRGYQKDAEEYHEFSRTKINVDGREAIILDCQVKYPFITTEVRVLTMYLRDNTLLWVVNCGVLSPKDFRDFQTDLNAVVRSLHILK